MRITETVIAFLKVNNPLQGVSFNNAALEKKIYPTNLNPRLMSSFGFYLRLLENVYLMNHVCNSSKASENKI